MKKTQKKLSHYKSLSNTLGQLLLNPDVKVDSFVRYIIYSDDFNIKEKTKIINGWIKHYFIKTDSD